MNKTPLLPAGFVATILVQAASAASIPIINPGFESQFVNDGFVVITTPTG